GPCLVARDVRVRRTWTERRTRIRSSVDPSHAQRAPGRSPPVPRHQVPAAVARVGQSYGLDRSGGGPARTIPIVEGQLALIPTGSRQCGESIGIQSRRGSTNRDRNRLKCSHSLAQAAGQQLIQLDQRAHGRLAHAGEGIHRAAEGYRNGYRFVVIQQQGRQRGTPAQLIATPRPRRGRYRVAEAAQSVDVAPHRSWCDLDTFGEPGARPGPARLQHREQTEQAGRGVEHETEDTKNCGQNLSTTVRYANAIHGSQSP